MALVEKGKKVVIVRGSDAGKEAEVLDIKEEKGKGTLLTVKIGKKERKVNIRHVEVVK